MPAPPSLPSLLIIPLMRALDALVKHAHGFVSTSNLHLHKVGLAIAALRARGHGPIDVLPRRGSAQNVVDLLLVGGDDLLHIRDVDGAAIGAGGTREDVHGAVAGPGGGGSRHDLEERAVEGTEPHDAEFGAVVAAL